MLVNDLLVTLTRTFLIIFTIITVADFLRHRDPVRRDIALVFVSLSSSTIILIFLAITGLQLPWLSKIGQIGVISEPFLLLRLVGYFRTVPRNVKRIALVGLVASIIVVVLFTTPLPPLATLVVIVYFVGISGYSVIGFIRGAYTSTGVARHRLRLAAVGSGMLLLLIFVAGIRVALPKTWPDISPLVQFMVILTLTTYYLGFAPPRWLRQGWQFRELRNYLLQDLPTLHGQSSSSVMARLRNAVTRAVGSDKVFIALWDQTGEKLVLENIPESAALRDFDLNKGIFKQVWHEPQPTVIYNLEGLSADDIRVMKALQAKMLFFVPFATKESAVGLLLVFLEHGSLFVDDDLDLLTIFAQQTAILLENFRILDAQRLYSLDLERTVQARTQALKQSNDELRQFAYIASHDLQEPLRMVVSYLQLLESRYAPLLDKDAHEFIGFAVDGAKRMKNLIEGLLTYSRVETREQNFTLVDSQKVLDEVLKLLSVAVSESGATITNDALPQIKANEAMILQLFQNLITNAMKYQKDNKPEIHIGATRQDKDWLFSVKDNGIGIDGKDLDRIFVIFQRLHHRNEYPGTGIGLAVCKKVVEHHGGRIWAESTVGEGTTFYFTLPAAT